VADEEVESEKGSAQLDDVTDRDELRNRYDMLLQEIRIALPGVQILSAFLLTAPFSQRFGNLDGAGRAAFGIALAASMVSVIALLGPTLLHHLGERTARSRRLMTSIVLVLFGLTALAVALVSALWGVSRFVFGTTTAWLITIPVVLVIVTVWLILPRTLRRHTTADGR
jgi:MFS family permease